MRLSSKSQSGFTLVEMSIVMIVIGLLIGGVLKGQELIQNTRVINFASQIKNIQVAILQFKDSTTAYPGDIRNQNFVAGCTAANFCVAGNGDGWIGQPYTGGLSLSDKFYTDSESPQFWKHLALMDLIGGVTSSGNPATPVIEMTHPTTTFRGVVEVYREAGGLFGNTNGANIYTGQMLRFSKRGLDPVAIDAESDAFISPQLAGKIDRKIDDGVGISGNMLVWDYGNHGCDNRLDGSFGFEDNITEPSCVVFYRLER